jgi:hypothetical protein
VNASFDLGNTRLAPECTAEIVRALLISWGLIDPELVEQAGNDVAAKVARLGTASGSLVHVEFSLDTEGLTSSVAVVAAPLNGTRRETSAEVAPTPNSDVVLDASVTVAQLAELLQVSTWFVRRRLASGGLPDPDASDATGQPLWRPATIESWRSEPRRGE